MGGSEWENVAVVGSGLAGLAAGLELQRRGRRVTLLEREGHVGGRAWSESLRSFALEPLSPVISSADRELLSLVSEVGMQDEFLPLRPVMTGQVHRRRVVDLDPRRLLDFARVPGVRPNQGLRLLRLPRLMRRYGARIDPLAPERAADLDDRSLADFGRLYFGRSVVDHWLAPLVTSVSYADEQETSRVHFLQRWARHALARRGLPRATLRELCVAAAAKVPTLTGATVGAVEEAADGSYRVSYRREGRERILEVDAVVVATGASDAARLAGSTLTTAETEILRRVAHTPIVTLAVTTCRPLVTHPREIRVPHVEGNPIETALIEPGLPAGRIPDGYGAITLRASGAWSAGALALPDETLEKELLDALEFFLPGSRATVEFTRVYRMERPLPRFGVGHYRALAQLARIEAGRLAEGRRVALAGDYRIDPSWNGAVVSGQRAARALAP